jgi:hypothetical protein
VGYRALTLVTSLGPTARRAIAAALLLVALHPIRLAAHPLHTSVAILSYHPATGRIDLSIRVFADDFERAAARRSAAMPASRAMESPPLGYIRASFVVTDASGRTIPLEWCGWRRQGDLVWICFRSRNAVSGRFMIADRIFHDLYDDQINIVQAKIDGRSINLLFTKDEKAKLVR